MSADEFKALERRWFEQWNKGKAARMAVIDELFATDVVYHDRTGSDIHDLKDYKQFISEMSNAIPDLHMTIDDMVVEGDKATMRFTEIGTHKGEFHGIPPTNKKITGWVISIDRIVDGKIVERWERGDTLGFMQQLGIVPTPKKGKR